MNRLFVPGILLARTAHGLRFKLGRAGNFRFLAGTICLLMSPIHENAGKSVNLEFESLVTLYYRSLYQFAFSLTRAEADACDLTQQTFYIWATKGHQLRDGSKVKTWLFTTLHREFLNMRRKITRFPHYELSEMDLELPVISPTTVNALDSARV